MIQRVPSEGLPQGEKISTSNGVRENLSGITSNFRELVENLAPHVTGDRVREGASSVIRFVRETVERLQREGVLEK